MKQFKLPLFLVAIAMTCIGLFAFNEAPKKEKQLQWYQLKTNGVPTNRADWEPATSDPGCPTVHSSEVCRIYAEDDNDMPSEASFEIVLDESDDFSIAAPFYVEYRDL